MAMQELTLQEVENVSGGQWQLYYYAPTLTGFVMNTWQNSAWSPARTDFFTTVASDIWDYLKSTYNDISYSFNNTFNNYFSSIYTPYYP